MRKKFASGLAAVGMAAVMVLPSAYAAQARSHREYRAERPVLSAGQSIDRADARVANLKADLLLSADQAKNWPGLESALHDVAVKRAKFSTERLAGERDLHTGRASAQTSATATSPTAGEDEEVDARGAARLDDIAKMRFEAEALAAQSADLRQIADAAKPLYDSLDERQRRRLVQFVHDDLRASEMDASRGRRR